MRISARVSALLLPVFTASACASTGSSASDAAGDGGSLSGLPGSGGTEAAAGSTGTSTSGGVSSAGQPGQGGGGGRSGSTALGGGTARGGSYGSAGEANQGGTDGDPNTSAGAPSEGGKVGAGAVSGASTLLFSPYKDTSIDLDWNGNIISTRVSGAPMALATELSARGVSRVTLAFATGECGKETWAGVDGATMAQANASKFQVAQVDYILSTGGAAGAFTCASDAGFAAFIARWQSPQLYGVDFDIEAGQSDAVITDLISRIPAARTKNSDLHFSLTLATLANNRGAELASPLGPDLSDSLSTHGRAALAAVRDVLGWKSPATWPGYLTINLMVMDYGAASPATCVVKNDFCDMGQSAIQAAHNLHDKWGVPYSNIELTPMIGGNDQEDEHFTLDDVDQVVSFVRERGLAGIHYWSYDRDVDCPRGPASPTCNSLGEVGSYGFLYRFLGALR